MPNANKRKGTAFETDVERYLRSQGLDDARRVVQRGINDEGDIHVWRLAIQAKDWERLDWSLFVRRAKEQAAAAGLPFGCAVAKRRGRNVRDAYVAMDLETLARLLLELERPGRAGW